ncbi:hypothetical protein AVEN_60530-1 [Araneus ventricosus]|uniref:Uncharacterized protein n=1 Tax=Araneus ventricosus TaxID=182803 RepID=A0A4Y2U1G7_ARAVE|nr:hypothetical protein AVEN_60530-1 [Araneus ventricosus]
MDHRRILVGHHVSISCHRAAIRWIMVKRHIRLSSDEMDEIHALRTVYCDVRLLDQSRHWLQLLAEYKRAARQPDRITSPRQNDSVSRTLQLAVWSGLRGSGW